MKLLVIVDENGREFNFDLSGFQIRRDSCGGFSATPISIPEGAEFIQNFFLDGCGGWLRFVADTVRVEGGWGEPNTIELNKNGFNAAKNALMQMMVS
jgi:hypothetical protein